MLEMCLHFPKPWSPVTKTKAIFQFAFTFFVCHSVKYILPCKNKGISRLHKSYCVPWIVFEGAFYISVTIFPLRQYALHKMEYVTVSLGFLQNQGCDALILGTVRHAFLKTKDQPKTIF